jgi:hypothetical protein
MKMRNLIQTEELAGRIARTTIGAQTSLANFLNAKINGLSKKRKIILLLAFTIVFAAMNICLLI